jgi:acetylornithine deacetylase/succinyl-diaminopimelate desuccinylase-like protein
LKQAGYNPVLWPRSAGSYPGYIFTGKPLNLGSVHLGPGHGSGAHAPDEYFLIDSLDRGIEGRDEAVQFDVKYLYELAK